MRATRIVIAAVTLVALAACTAGGLGTSRGGPFAPQVDPNGQAVDQLLVGHRLMAASEFELALDAFKRAAAERGLDAEVLSAMGTANLALGRLNQSEDLLRRAVTKPEVLPEAWNNLGVVLMEQGKSAEAAQIFRKAYALDNGQSDAIRDNLRKALAKIENPDYDEGLEEEYKLIRRGSSDYLIRRTP